MALLGATFTLTSHEQFLGQSFASLSGLEVLWNRAQALCRCCPDELHDLGQIERDASLEGVDYALRSFIAFAAHFYGEFLCEKCLHIQRKHRELRSTHRGLLTGR